MKQILHILSLLLAKIFVFSFVTGLYSLTTDANEISASAQRSERPEQTLSTGTVPPTGTSRLAIYVSPDGSDDHPGTVSSPFQTLEKARDTVRTMNQNMASDLTVFLRGGSYQLPTTLIFDQTDSGTNGFNVIYRAYPGEKPVITGGELITGWSPVGAGVVKASVSTLRFRQLYVNGTRAIRARTPNAGRYYRIRSWDRTNNQIGVNRHEIANWQRLNEVEMVHQKIMALNFMRIASFSSSDGTAYLVPAEPERTRTFIYQHYPHGASGQAYHFENAYEFLDAPGEWYLNTQTDEVFYRLRPREAPDTLVVIAPYLETLIRIGGALDSPVHHIQFHGLTFAHSSWLLPSSEGHISDGGSGLVLTEPLPSDQLTSYPGIRPPAAVYLENAHDIRFERNIFRHLGANGVLLYAATRNHALIGNVFLDISGNGIAVDMNLEGNPIDHRKICKDIIIRNNYIHNVAQDFGVGIHAGYPVDLKIEHNEVVDTPYTGILVGWGWSLEDNVMRNNLIRFNEVSHVMNLLADGGGIYTLSKQPGTHIAENYIHDILRSPWASSRSYPIAALYLDNGSDLLRVENNVLRKVEHKLYLNRIMQPDVPPVGPNNLLRNNVEYSSAIIDKSGLEPEYRDIKSPYGFHYSRPPGGFSRYHSMVSAILLLLPVVFLVWLINPLFIRPHRF